MLERQTLPSFFIGPPCTGSSWLHQILSSRAALPKSTKETRFFDCHFHRGIEWYRAHYPSGTEEMKAGEVAPTYFASVQARSRIGVLNPHAKVVCTFRNPVDRVLSLYRLKRAYGMFSWSLEEAMLRDPELSESGKDATHLTAWQSALGPDRVLATFYEDLKHTPQAYLDVLTDFIGVRRFELTFSDLRFTHTAEQMTLPRNYHRTRIGTEIAHWLKARHLNMVVAKAKESCMLKLFLGGGASFSASSSESD